MLISENSSIYRDHQGLCNSLNLFTFNFVYRFVTYLPHTIRSSCSFWLSSFLSTTHYNFVMSSVMDCFYHFSGLFWICWTAPIPAQNLWDSSGSIKTIASICIPSLITCHPSGRPSFVLHDHLIFLRVLAEWPCQNLFENSSSKIKQIICICVLAASFKELQEAFEARLPSTKIRWVFSIMIIVIYASNHFTLYLLLPVCSVWK